MSIGLFLLKNDLWQPPECSMIRETYVCKMLWEKGRVIGNDGTAKPV